MWFAILIAMNESTPSAQPQYTPELPPAEWEAVAGVVLQVMELCAGKTPYSRRRLTYVIAHHAAWCWRSGLPLEIDELFSRELVDASMAFAFKHLSPGSLSTLRAQLLRVGEALAPAESIHRLKALPGSGTSIPYNPGEVASLYGWALGQASEQRRKSSLALISLGLGAGLSSGEILAARARHVRVDALGLQVRVMGSRTRTVQMRADWEAALEQSMNGSNPDDYIFRPGSRVEHLNSITNFVARSRGLGVKPLGQRMRATWIVHHLQRATPVVVLMQAAGIESLEALTRYVQFLERPSEDAARAMLRGMA